MTIDERIEKLTERHEALGQYVELLAHESARHDRQIAELTSSVNAMNDSVKRLAAIAETALDSINALARIAESHERRITRIDGGQA
jgi:methyl-accepting chemotaxis protein